jgi:hypothetical protein
MSDQFSDEDRYWSEFKMLQDTLFRTWQMYISWFTWYFGINFGALAWILTAEKLKNEWIIPVCTIMTLENLIALGPASIVYFYTLSIRNRGGEISTALSHPPVTPDAMNRILGKNIMDVTAWAIVVGLIILSVGWVWIALIPIKR